MDKKEKNIIKQCSDNGIINVRKLKEIEDYNMVIKVLKENPITLEEYLLNLYKEGKHSELFAFAVDNDLNYIKRFYLIKNGQKVLGATLEEAMKYEIAKNPYYRKLATPFYSYMDILISNIRIPNYPNSLLGEINAFKDKFINDLLRKHNHVQQIRDILIKNHIKINSLRKMLEERNFRHLSIDLCSAIEVVLNEKYHLEGGLQETMLEYTKSICKNEAVKPLLHKLRKYRNKCVHSNKEFDYEEPTYVEFEYLVNYVTNFGYGDDEYE